MTTRTLGGLALLLGLAPAHAQTVTYVHTDALGSPVLETNASGAAVREVDYRAYGDEVLSAAKEGPAFTGHYRDTGTGLVYMQQRYYDPQTGRFVSIDPVAADPGTGGNFNRYWYADNNPYHYTDPDGRHRQGDGFTEKQWERFDGAQQAQADRFDEAAAQLTNALDTGRRLKRVSRAFETIYGKGSATSENMAAVASALTQTAAAMRDTSATAIPVNGMTFDEIVAEFPNANPDAVANASTGPTRINVNLSHPLVWDRGVLRGAAGHESTHAVL